MMALLGLLIGGAVGAIGRDVVTRLIGRVAIAQSVPAGTLVVNVLGSALLGLLIGYRAEAGPEALLSDAVYLALGVGFCGSFTTFSTFMGETHAMWREGRRAAAALYWGLTLGLSAAASAVGLVA